ncbi:rho guanine nucleotide exchange factor 10-like protein [Brachyistius frenatus]|uniref:rho guanine nucleotide exchange factor 10-like protein n=1 Tax=Brachyistius frenatus TaxID=100188 RepID=UPI0037E7956F
MVRSGGGVWMVFTRCSSIHLFHTETLEPLQEVNISTRNTHLSPGPVHVSSLLVCQGLLWVGTSRGVILTFPVPTLEGIPKITGKGTMSLNAHCGPVDFLVSPSCSLASNLFRRDSVWTGSEEAGNGEGGGEEGEGGDEEGQRVERSSCPGDPDAPPLKEERPRVVLQYRLFSTCQLPGKPLTALPDHGGPRTPQEALEHSPEDGSIYEVSEDPDVWVRGRPVEWGREGEGRRSRVISTAIFSGGRGYRRLGQVNAADGSDSSENTLLVWQLPLSLSQ